MVLLYLLLLLLPGFALAACQPAAIGAVRAGLGDVGREEGYLACRPLPKSVDRYAGTLTNGGGPDLEGIVIDTARWFLAPGSRARYSMGEVHLCAMD